MPLFGRGSNPETPATTTSTGPPPKRSSTLFGRRRSPSPVAHETKHHNLLHRNTEDPSIAGARERVLSAETAEREADIALKKARHAVKEARDEVKRLEREAAEESRVV
ncbi:MAG: hypothetical protein Q9160_001154 [Pyrenula sp. 1 TL-2023]